MVRASSFLGLALIAGSIAAPSFGGENISRSVREPTLVGMTTCEVESNTLSYYVFESLPDPRYALEYRKLEKKKGGFYEALLLVERRESRDGSGRCDKIMAVQGIKLRRLDFVAIECTEKGRHLPSEPLVVGIGYTPPPRPDDRFVARKAWAVDLNAQLFSTLSRRLLICTPPRIPE